MGVAEVPEHGLFVVAHPAREVRIAESLITRGFRHILQDAQLLLHHLLAIPRHLAPLRKHIVLDVVALLRCQVTPSLFVAAQACLLLRRHVIPLTELLANLVLFVRREALERMAVLQDALTLLRAKVAHGIDPGTSRACAGLLAVVQIWALSVVARPVQIVVAGAVLIIEIILRWMIISLVGISRTIRIRRRTIRIRMVLRMRRGRMRLSLRGPVVMRLLCPGAPGRRGKARGRENHCAELEILPHFLRFCSSARPLFLRSGPAAGGRY